MISCFSMLIHLRHRMFLFWMHKGSDYTVPTRSRLNPKRRPFFLKPPPNSPDHIILRPGCNESLIVMIVIDNAVLFH